MIVFEFERTDDYATDAFRRHEAMIAPPKTRQTILILVFVGILCVTGIFGMRPDPDLPAPVVLMGAAFGLVMFVLVGYPYLMKRFRRWLSVTSARRSPFAGAETRVELTAEGVRSACGAVETFVRWNAVRAARRFPDGFLLVRNDASFDWLPTRGMTHGSGDEAYDLIRRHAPHYDR